MGRAGESSQAGDTAGGGWTEGGARGGGQTSLFPRRTDALSRERIVLLSCAAVHRAHPRRGRTLLLRSRELARSFFLVTSDRGRERDCSCREDCEADGSEDRTRGSQCFGFAGTRASLARAAMRSKPVARRLAQGEYTLHRRCFTFAGCSVMRFFLVECAAMIRRLGFVWFAIWLVDDFVKLSKRAELLCLDREFSC